MEIVEKQLGIPPDYQYKALRFGPWIQKNWHANKFLIIKNILANFKGKTVLDLGTGSGNFELLFSKDFVHLYGVDYNDEALSFLRNKLRSLGIKNVSLFQSDIRNLPPEVTKRKYDCIVTVDTIEHIKLEDAKRVIKGLKKLLNKGGVLVIITPNTLSLWVLIEWVLDKFTIVPKFAGSQHLGKFTPESIKEVLTAAKITPVNCFTFNLFSYLCPWVSLRRKLVNFEQQHIGYTGCLLVAVGVS